MSFYVTRRHFDSVVGELNERMDTLEASQSENQAKIDAETAAVQALGPKLDMVKQEVDALKAAQAGGQALDFANLDAALAAVTTQTDADVAEGQVTPPATP
jgi:hypothetical protein